MTDAELAEARALCAAATSGPLETIPSRNPNADDCACPVFDVVAPAGEIEQVPCAELCVEEDARLYAAAPTLIPRLVDEIDRLRTKVADIERQRDARAADVDVRIERINRMTRQIEEHGAEIDRLRADLEFAGPPEPPAEAFTAPDGPPVPCEVCCAPIEPGSPVASWVDGESWIGSGRQVVAHAGRCPEPEMWCVEWMARSAPNLWLRAHYGVKQRLPYEEACGEALKVASEPHTARVRLIRVRAVRP